ncbi:thiamine pyrophosphate-dependent enzyme [Calothrix sp. NIES-3974]|uniref:thiamine pyrophosphate-dependent enzyme n=1 Tax=Calothrix sp. NIES-3974 TaxID=2005462 RepID=UPI000B5DE72D|nr:thiamine pyrophosphate-dependent enzyme [Calothrix sp. NIES-3974]BAZ03482.1 thiamine pyrophosphate binding domain-containing protein [Calothrix sp. NIES-3974]
MLITTKSSLKQKNEIANKIDQPVGKVQTQATVAEALVQMLQDLGVRHAFGIGGGGIVPIWDALEKSPIDVLYFRHESGAAFAAMEAYFANGCPVAVFTTTGPGITNALTGLMAARWEGAKILLISPSTPKTHEGKWAFQETNFHTMPQEIFSSGSVFHYAHQVQSGNELPKIAQELAVGFAKTGGFVAHLNIPSDVQTSHAYNVYPDIPSLLQIIPDGKTIDLVSKILFSESLAIWVGFGARDAAKEILQIAERTGAAVMSSPRGKGIFPENHPLYLGVTGFAGHDSVLEFMKSNPPQRILVLGTRLGEFTSFWNPLMIPPKGFIHVDIDQEVPKAAYPQAETIPIIADIKAFTSMLVEKLPPLSADSPVKFLPKFYNSMPSYESRENYTGLVRPIELMKAIQELIVEGSNATIFADAGNCLSWAVHYLKFDRPKRWRGSTGFGSMGNATTGVVGATLVSRSKSVVLVGDGAMLMNNEVNTAVKYNIPAVWIVFNDASYNMCNQGAVLLGRPSIKADIAPTDFAMLAISMGADGICVNHESQIRRAILKAMKSKVPFVIDVKINPEELAPIGQRMHSIGKLTNQHP